MNSRYLVFVSSTFKDLEVERRAVTEAILSLHWFPSGMEIFPASNTTPWSLIESMIKDADYYVLIIGGMYGSTDEEGISYTEREYDLAVAEGVPVLAFLPALPNEIPRGKTENRPAIQKKLEAFQQKVKSHHCKFWSGVEDLRSKVVVSLIQESVSNPRAGWVKNDRRDSAETLKKLSDALEENIKLTAALQLLQEAASGEDLTSLAQGEDLVQIRWSKQEAPYASLTWSQLWKVMGPTLLTDTEGTWAFDATCESLVNYLNSIEQSDFYRGLELSADCWESIIYQLIAIDFLSPVTVIDKRGSWPGYRATQRGMKELALSHAVRRSQSGA